MDADLNNLAYLRTSLGKPSGTITHVFFLHNVERRGWGSNLCGKILADIIERHGLTIGNAMDKCEGLITRKRATTKGVEESTISVFTK